jgi:hypothetical protein
MAIELKEERVGSQWLITSPELAGLFVADSDLEAARKAVPEAIAMLERMAERRQERKKFNKLANTA